MKWHAVRLLCLESEMFSCVSFILFLFAILFVLQEGTILFSREEGLVIIELYLIQYDNN